MPLIDPKDVQIVTIDTSVFEIKKQLGWYDLEMIPRPFKAVYPQDWDGKASSTRIESNEAEHNLGLILTFVAHWYEIRRHEGGPDHREPIEVTEKTVKLMTPETGMQLLDIIKPIYQDLQRG